MPIDTLHADHIGAVGGGFELQRSNNALLYIVNLAGNENDLITFSLASFPLPKLSSGIIEVPYLNEKRKFAGQITYDDISIVINDYVDKDTSKLLHQWRYLVQNPVTGKVGFKKAYAKEARMVMFGPDGTQEREYTLKGVWPSSLDAGEADFASEDGVKINLTLSIDKVIYVPAAA